MILDILSSNIALVGQMDFTAVEAPPLTVTVNPPVGNAIFCEDANGNKWIQAGDNLLLQRIWCNIPFGFGQGTGQAYVGLGFVDVLNNTSIISELAGNGIQTLPDICHVMEFPGDGLFIQVPNAVGRVKWTVQNLVLKLSMVNLPAVLVGQVIPLQMHFQVLHTKPIMALP